MTAAAPGYADRATLRAYWSYAKPLLITSPIGILQDSLDRILVARWAGLTAAGYYQVARVLWEILGTLNASPSSRSSTASDSVPLSTRS